MLKAKLVRNVQVCVQVGYSRAAISWNDLFDFFRCSWVIAHVQKKSMPNQHIGACYCYVQELSFRR